MKTQRFRVKGGRVHHRVPKGSPPGTPSLCGAATLTPESLHTVDVRRHPDCFPCLATRNREGFHPDWRSPPGETIQDLLDREGIRHSVFANAMDLTDEEAAALLRGDRALTSTDADRLEAIFGAPAAFWVRREAHFRKPLRGGARPKKLEGR